MSTILDALRKAQAERSRGAVPPLDAPPLVGLPVLSPGETSRRRLGRGVAAALAAALLAAMAWWSQGRQVAREGPEASTRSEPLSPPASTSVPSGAATTEVVAQAIALPAPPVAVPAALATAAPAKPVLPTPVPTAPLPAAPTPSATAPAAPGPSVRLPTHAELPDTVRAAMPPLAMAGLVWSEQPSSRFVMVDGQLLREGDTVAPDLVLERIGQRSVLLRWRDQRFEKPYRP